MVDGGRCHNEIVFCLSREKGLSGHLKIRTKIICLMVADTIGVNRSTARSIVARYIREGRIAERPRGGANNVRVDNEMKDCLNDILNDNCMLTLAQINQELRRRLSRKPRIHDRTVARTLDGMLFRFKIVRRQPAERNRPDVIQKRHDYAN